MVIAGLYVPIPPTLYPIKKKKKGGGRGGKRVPSSPRTCNPHSEGRRKGKRKGEGKRGEKGGGPPGYIFFDKK